MTRFGNRGIRAHEKYVVLNRPSTVNRRILHGISGGAFQTLVSIAVVFLQYRLILAYLPKNVAGTWFLFVSIGMYIAFFDLGISPTVSREIGEMLGDLNSGQDRRYAEIADLIATCTRIFEILAAIVFVLGVAAGWWMLRELTPPGFPVITLAWFVFVLGASLDLLGGTAFAALYGTGNIAVERILRAASQIIGLFLCALFLHLGFGIIGVAASWTCQVVLGRIAAFVALSRRLPELRTGRGRARADMARKIAAPSLKWAATTLGASLILQTDNVIIAATIGTHAIPSYEAVSRLSSTIAGFALIVVTSASPFLTRSYAAGDMDHFKTILFRNVRCCMSFMGITVPFLAFFGNHIVDAWLGPGNFVGYPVLWAFLIMLSLEVHHVSLATAVMATGRIVFAWMALAAGFINIVITLILVRYLGLWGVALGTMLAQMLTNNWYAPYVALKLLDIHPYWYFRNVILPICCLFAAMFGVNFAATHMLGPSPGLAAVAVAFLLTVPIGTAMTAAFVLPGSDRQAVLSWYIARKGPK